MQIYFLESNEVRANISHLEQLKLTEGRPAFSSMNMNERSRNIKKKITDLFVKSAGSDFQNQTHHELEHDA